MGFGAILGAVVGSVVAPGVGTAIGAGIGGAVDAATDKGDDKKSGKSSSSKAVAVPAKPIVTTDRYGHPQITVKDTAGNNVIIGDTGSVFADKRFLVGAGLGLAALLLFGVVTLKVGSRL